ncbi:2S seed storage protein 1-like [Henckelia pumila]|uniref:2S seed storage protein 1-like n=1 Tax=Henckelia pumila TaxID=405737 RepID=UPI003C6E58B9
MAKVIAFAALFAALLAVASATTYTTVVTTTVVDDVNPRGGEDSCMQEYEQQQKMRHCQMWMQEKMGGKYMDVSFLRTAVSNPMGGQGEHLQQCCQQMEQISAPCKCQVMKMMWKQQREEGSKGEMREMREMLENLPQMCGMQMREECRLSSF